MDVMNLRSSFLRCPSSNCWPTLECAMCPSRMSSDSREPDKWHNATATNVAPLHFEWSSQNIVDTQPDDRMVMFASSRVRWYKWRIHPPGMLVALVHSLLTYSRVYPRTNKWNSVSKISMGFGTVLNVTEISEKTAYAYYIFKVIKKIKLIRWAENAPTGWHVPITGLYIHASKLRNCIIVYNIWKCEQPQPLNILIVTLNLVWLELIPSCLCKCFVVLFSSWSCCSNVERCFWTQFATTLFLLLNSYAT